MTQNLTSPSILPPYEFYMVRHGESEANVRRVAAGGGLDSPLTDLGIQQAKTLASVIHHLPVKPSRLYHSPQIRAKNTAQHLNEFLKLEMVEMDNLKEHMFGDWENVIWETLRPIVEAGGSPPNGESYDVFAERVRGALHQIFTIQHEAPPIVVAHGGLFRSIGRLYQLKTDPVHNCALFHYVPNGENAKFPWTVTSYTPQPNGLKKEKLF